MKLVLWFAWNCPAKLFQVDKIDRTKSPKDFKQTILWYQGTQLSKKNYRFFHNSKRFCPKMLVNERCYFMVIILIILEKKFSIIILLAVISKFLQVKFLISVDCDASACPVSIIGSLSILLHEFLEWHASWNFNAHDILASTSSWEWSILTNVCENSQWAHGSSVPESISIS